MKRMVMAAVFVLCVAIGLACAQDRGTADEARAMLDRAVAFYKANGPEEAFVAFNDPQGPFVNKDLYIFAVNMDGKVVAHGAKAGLIGQGMSEIKDADQKNFIAEMVAVARAKGAGTVNYWWENPQFQVVEEKCSYIEKVDEAVLGCGYYKSHRWQPREK